MALAKSISQRDLVELAGYSSTKRYTVEQLKRGLTKNLKDTNYVIKTQEGLPDLKVYTNNGKYYIYQQNINGQNPIVTQIDDADTLAYLKQFPNANKETILGGLGVGGREGYWFDPPRYVVNKETKNGVTTTQYSDGSRVTTYKGSKPNTNTEQKDTTPASTSGYNPYYEALNDRINTLSNDNKTLQEKLDEANRVYTGDELAEHYGIKDTLYSRDYWKNLYTDYVNEMYDDLINQQNEYRSRFARNNATYDDYLEKEYINSYNNASNARTTRGAIAANALSTGNVNDYNSSKNDISMLQNIYGYEALRQAGLADVENQAEKAANNNRAILMQYGAKHNTSDVTAATNALNAAATMYGADKNYLAGLASAANAKYGGLVNSASANANSTYQRMYDYYMNAFNNDKATASSYLTNILEGKTGGNS